MRNTVIDIYQASQKDRARLYDHLIALGEPIYSGIGLRNKDYGSSVFIYPSSLKEWSGTGSTKQSDAISIDAFIEKYPVTTQESEKDYAIICKDSSIEDRKLIYLHLENLNYKMYKHTNFITLQNYTSSDIVYSYDKEQWKTDRRESITTHIKLISIKDFIAKFIKTSKQSLIEQDSSVQIGQKYRNSSGNINILAFFKESGEPWTEAELDSVRSYCGDFEPRAPMGPSTPKRKYAYYTEKTNSGLKVYLWDDQIYPEKLNQVSYESIFGASTKEQPKTSVESKPTESAQTEPIKQSKPKIEREKKSMAKAIKETAVQTLDQNKQAAIIAGKMEAGRILNKQVIKQIKPHIPMFVRGYLDTPLAPIVVANLVAAIGNHTQNRRVQQVSELMLLAAADTTVQSFNLDKIIDDVLAGVKLPAGILTSDEE